MINKVDAAEARLAACLAANRRAGVATAALSGLTLCTATAFILIEMEAWLAILSICSMVGWVGAAKRYERAAHRVARARVRLIDAEEKQSMKLERRLEW